MNSSRRRFFRTVGSGAAGLTIGSAVSLATGAANNDKDGPVLLIGDNIALAETTFGKVRGYVLRGIHHFLGIPYGADTSGGNRFMPPRRPKSWTDVFPAIWWGNTAPKNMENRYANKYASFRDHWNYDDVSEDCLRINVFTPAVNDGKKRPTSSLRVGLMRRLKRSLSTKWLRGSGRGPDSARGSETEPGQSWRLT